MVFYLLYCLHKKTCIRTLNEDFLQKYGEKDEEGNIELTVGTIIDVNALVNDPKHTSLKIGVMLPKSIEIGISRTLTSTLTCPILLQRESKPRRNS